MPDLDKRLDEIEKKLDEISSTKYAVFGNQVSSYNEEINIRELWNIVWAGKWIIVATSFVFMLSSVFYAISLPNIYKSEALLVPENEKSGSGLAGLEGQLGGLANLAGVSLGDAGVVDKSVIAMEILKTWGFLEGFIEKYDIKEEVFAVKGWNKKTNELVYDDDLYDPAKGEWVREYNLAKGQTLVPSSWELYKAFRDRIKVSKDKTSQLIKVSVEYYSPRIAKEWTELLVKEINAHVQQRDRQDALKSIEYLTTKIQETNVAGMQAVFYQLIEEQTKTLMLAEVGDEYVFKILSPPKVPEEKERPKRALIVLVLTFVGGIIGLLVVFFREFVFRG